MINEVYVINGNINEQKQIKCTFDEEGNESGIEVKGNFSEERGKLAYEFARHGLNVKDSNSDIVMEHGKLTNENIPVLLFYPKLANKLPVVFFVHGFSGNKNWDIGNGIRLAQEGFFTVILDARNHGERHNVSFFKSFDNDDFVKSNDMYIQLRLDTAKDISTLIDFLKDDERVDSSRIGMSGVSMGGFITFSTILLEKRIKAAAPIIASPVWDYYQYDEKIDQDDVEDPLFHNYIKQYEPYTNYKLMSPTALLVQNGDADSVVSIDGARKLDEKMKVLYHEMPDHYQLIEYPGVGHTVTTEMIDQVIEWFKKFL